MQPRVQVTSVSSKVARVIHDFRLTSSKYIFSSRSNTGTDIISFSDTLTEHHPRKARCSFTFALISKLRLVHCLTLAQLYFTEISLPPSIPRLDLWFTRRINNHACLYFLFNSNYAIYAEISRESGAKAKNTSKWIPIFTEYHRYIFARTRVCVSSCMRDWCMFAREYLHLHGKYDELCRTWFSTHVLPTSPCSRLAPFPDIYRLEPQPWPFIHHDDNENGVDEKDLLVSR